MQWSRAGILPRIALRTHGRIHEPGIVGPRSEPVPIELRLRELSRPRCFNERRWCQRCGHAGRSIGRKAEMAGRNDQEREAHASGEC